MITFKPKQVTKKLLGAIGERARDVLEKRYGLGNDSETFTLEAIGQTYGITRERVRPQMNIATKEVCPTCNGTGKIMASILVTDQIEKNIEHLFVKQNEKHLVLALHPFLYAFYTKGIISLRMKWYFKHKSWVALVKDSSLAITEFKFLNRDGEEIELANQATTVALAD